METKANVAARENEVVITKCVKACFLRFSRYSTFSKRPFGVGTSG